MLTKKVDALTKAMEVEWKKMKREAAAREREAALTKSENNRKNKSTNSSKRFYNFTVFYWFTLCSLLSLIFDLIIAIQLMQGDERTLKILC